MGCSGDARNCPSPWASTRKLYMGPATPPRPGRWPWRLSEVLELVPRTCRFIKLCLDKAGFPLASWTNALVHSISWGHLKESEKVLVVQSCPTDPMDYSPPGTSVHGILQAKNTGVSCHTLLQGIFQTQRSNPYLLFLLHWQGLPWWLRW